MDCQAPKLNRLADAKSPYLLQHATNPVDWYEWSPAAFTVARERNVPIFLSVGYSACHWCHVLAHESFEDPEVAKVMNENYLNIKVDREERPDVDALYMTFLQATSGGGGWPMSIFLTPTLKPIFAATYLPRIQFISILRNISSIWTEKQDEVISSSTDILNQLRAATAPAPPTSLSLGTSLHSLSSKLYDDLSSKFDIRYGGFGQRGPKFPAPAQTLDFLATYTALSPPPSSEAGLNAGVQIQPEPLETQKHAAMMAIRTLRGIWEGGIRDHIGGGIARYSVDERWHVPHFEKMLYDQAQLSISALSLSLLPPRLLSSTSDPELLRDLAANILEYVEQDLFSNRDARQDGNSGIPAAFWSAEDADSRKAFEGTGANQKGVGPTREGAFYVWSVQEIDGILLGHTLTKGTKAAEVFKRRFGIKDEGNVDPASDIEGELRHQNVLYHAASVEKVAKDCDLSVDEAGRLLAVSLTILKEWRDENRPRPHLDDKIVAGWNGLMISAYALASLALPKDGSYPIQSRALTIAEQAAHFVLKNMVDGVTYEMHRTWRDGDKGPRGQADDYAFFIRGLLDLYEASGKEYYLLQAIRLQETQDRLFWDETNGGYFTSAEDEYILIRQKDTQDGAEPSAVSITISNLSRLSHFDSSRAELYLSRITDTSALISSILERTPRAVAASLTALFRHQAGHRQFIVLGSPSSPTVQEYINILRGETFIPNGVLIRIDPDALPTGLAARNEVIKDIVDHVERQRAAGKPIEEEENVRLCEGFTCQLPVKTLEQVRKLVLQTQ